MSSNEFAPVYGCCGGITFHSDHCPTRIATDVQPMSTPNAEPTVYSLVLADLAARDEMGREKYGKSLQPHNGRDALVDAYQEHLDELFYLRQKIEEDKATKAEIATLRADLAASQREVERLRHGEATAEDGVCPDAVEIVRLQAEMERLRKIFDDAGHGEHNVLALVDHYQDEVIKATAEVERCRELIIALVENACEVDAIPLDAVPLDSCGMQTNADALRYLAEIGRVEIVSEHGRRVIARWK